MAEPVADLALKKLFPNCTSYSAMPQKDRSQAVMTTDDEMRGFIESNRVDQAVAYAQAGRKHASLSLDALKTGWVVAFRAMAAQPFDRATHSVHTAYDSELVLRGTEPPYDLVKNEMQAFTSAAIEDMQDCDPEALSDLNKDLERQLLDFRLKREGRS